MESPSLLKRALLGVVFAVATGVLVFIVLFCLGFAVTASLHGSMEHLAGFYAVFLPPFGALLAAVAAFVAQLPPYGERPWIRWILVPFVFIFLGAAFFALLAFYQEPETPRRHVERRGGPQPWNTSSQV